MELITIQKPDEEWDDFVKKYSNIIFHSSIWAKVLEYSYPEAKLLYFVLKDKNEWFLALPGLLFNYKFFNLFYSLIHYGGFIGRREYIPIFLELLKKEAKNYKLDRIQILDPLIKKADELRMYRFKPVSFYRHILNLKEKTEESILKGYKLSLRRNIKKTKKSTLIFEKIIERKQVEDFYKLYLFSMERNKALAKYPLKLIYKIYDFMINDLADIFFIKFKNRPIASILVIYSKDTAHYVQGGSDANYLNLRANDLLFHEAIKISIDRGKNYFDFLGSNKRYLSLIQYKEKFGAEREEIFSFYKDVGYIAPLMWNIVYKLANTSIGVRIVNRIKHLFE